MDYNKRVQVKAPTERAQGRGYTGVRGSVSPSDANPEPAGQVRAVRGGRPAAVAGIYGAWASLRPAATRRRRSGCCDLGSAATTRAKIIRTTTTRVTGIIITSKEIEDERSDQEYGDEQLFTIRAKITARRSRWRVETTSEDDDKFQRTGNSRRRRIVEAAAASRATTAAGQAPRITAGCEGRGRRRRQRRIRRSPAA